MGFDTGAVGEVDGKDISPNSVEADDIDINGADFVGSGDFIPLLTYDMGATSDFSTTSTSYTAVGLDFGRFSVLYDDMIPDGADGAFLSFVRVSPGAGETVAVRVRNFTDSETIHEQTGITSSGFQEFGPTTYTPPNKSRRFAVLWEIKTDDGSNSSRVSQPQISLGIQL